MAFFCCRPPNEIWCQKTILFNSFIAHTFFFLSCEQEKKTVIVIVCFKKLGRFIFVCLIVEVKLGGNYYAWGGGEGRGGREIGDNRRINNIFA